jgi:hypothetical protein
MEELASVLHQPVACCDGGGRISTASQTHLVSATLKRGANPEKAARILSAQVPGTWRYGEES